MDARALGMAGWVRKLAVEAIGDAGEGHARRQAGQGGRQTVDGTADLRPGRAVGELSIDHLSVGSCRPPDSFPSQTQIALILQAKNEPLQRHG